MGGRGGQGLHRSQSLHIPKFRDGYGGATPRAPERPRHSSTTASRGDSAHVRRSATQTGSVKSPSSGGHRAQRHSPNWNLENSPSAGRFFVPSGSPNVYSNACSQEQVKTPRAPRSRSHHGFAGGAKGTRQHVESPIKRTANSPKTSSNINFSADYAVEHTGIPIATLLNWNTNTKKRSAEQEIFLSWSDPDPGNFDYRNPREIAETKNFELRERRLGPYDLQAFRVHMCKKYGNLVRAFRLGLDTTGNGILTKCEFGPAARGQGFEGNIRKLWSELDDDNGGYITLNEWAPKDAPLLQAFKKHLVENYETAETAWWDLCRHKETYLKLDAFTTACKKIGFDGDTTVLHRILCSDRGASKLVVLEDIDWLGNCDFGLDDNESENGNT